MEQTWMFFIFKSPKNNALQNLTCCPKVDELYFQTAFWPLWLVVRTHVCSRSKFWRSANVCTTIWCCTNFTIWSASNREWLVRLRNRDLYFTRFGVCKTFGFAPLAMTVKFLDTFSTMTGSQPFSFYGRLHAVPNVPSNGAENAQAVF